MQHPQESLTPHNGKIFDPLEVLKACGIHAGMRVADFGCGHGHFVYPTAELVGNRGSVYAVDLQHELLGAIENHAKTLGLLNIELVWADLEALGATKIPNNLLDVVLLVNNHIDSTVQQKMLREAVRVLRPGGQVLLIDWLDGNTIPFAPAISERVKKEISLANAQSLGMRFIDEFRPSRYHYGLRLQKA
jgi:ubiquinone/menaquinone biosynthesis C-methylase UbiE